MKKWKGRIRKIKKRNWEKAKRLRNSKKNRKEEENRKETEENKKDICWKKISWKQSCKKNLNGEEKTEE